MPNPNGNGSSLKPFNKGPLWPSSQRLAIQQAAYIQSAAAEVVKQVMEAKSDTEMKIARARAQAVASSGRCFCEARSQLRIEQGKHNPATVKPGDRVKDRAKTKPASLAPSE